LKSYADTSFLVSLYVPDVHSAPAISAMGRIKESVLITAFSEVELCNAIALRIYRKEITELQAKAATRAFEQDIQTGVLSLQPMRTATFQKAKKLARRHTALLGTRTLDLLHVAAALTSGANGLLSFDARQRKLAHEVGLSLRPKAL
jgi:predicted nucleic acid-binding protein